MYRKSAKEVCEVHQKVSNHLNWANTDHVFSQAQGLKIQKRIQTNLYFHNFKYTIYFIMYTQVSDEWLHSTQSNVHPICTSVFTSPRTRCYV